MESPDESCWSLRILGAAAGLATREKRLVSERGWSRRTQPRQEGAEQRCADHHTRRRHAPRPLVTPSPRPHPLRETKARLREAGAARVRRAFPSPSSSSLPLSREIAKRFRSSDFTEALEDEVHHEGASLLPRGRERAGAHATPTHAWTRRSRRGAAWTRFSRRGAKTLFRRRRWRS